MEAHNGEGWEFAFRGITMDGNQGGLVMHATVDIGRFNAVTIEAPSTSGVD